MTGTEPYRFSIDYWVPYADTDQMGVVYYANFLVIFERARSALLRDAGYPYSKMEEEGFMLPVMEAHVDYTAPARFDDKLTVSVCPEFLGRIKTRIRCRVHRDNELLAEGYTIHVCYSSERNRPSKFPASFIDAVKAYEASE